MQSHEERADEMLRMMGGSITLASGRIILRRLVQAEDKVVDLQQQLDLDTQEFKARESMWITKIQQWETLAREKNWGAVHDERHDRLVASVQEAAALLDFEANLGPPEHQATLREVVQRLTEALNE